MPKLSKTQIDRLGDRLRQRPIRDVDLELLDEYRRSFGEAYETVVKVIRDQLQLVLTGRPAKSTTSIIEKLRRESIRLSQIQDIAGCRILVADVVQQEQALESLRTAFTGASVIDRRIKPTYGYRALHVIPRINGKLIEIQLRTSLQHLWAEVSEKFADVYNPALKYGQGQKEILEVLAEASRMVANFERAEERFLKLQAKSLFSKTQDKDAFEEDLRELQNDMDIIKAGITDHLRDFLSSLETKKRQEQ